MYCRRCAANKPPSRANNQRWFICTTSQIGLSLVPYSAVRATSNTPLPTTLAVRAQHWPLPTHCWPWLTEHWPQAVCCGRTHSPLCREEYLKADGEENQRAETSPRATNKNNYAMSAHAERHQHYIEHCHGVNFNVRHITYSCCS